MSSTNRPSSSKRQPSIFSIFGVLGRLDALEDAITEMKADMKELKYTIVFFAALYFLFNQWDKSVMRNDIRSDMAIVREERRQDKEEAKKDMAILREERRQDKEEAKKDMAVMREEMQRNFYITTFVAIVPLVSSFFVSLNKNNNNDKK